MIPLYYYLILAAVLFAVGLAGALTRRNAILVLVGIELMLKRGQPELHRVLALQSRPGQPHRRYVCDFFHCHRGRRGGGGSRAHHSDLPALQTVNVDKMDSLKG